MLRNSDSAPIDVSVKTTGRDLNPESQGSSGGDKTQAVEGRWRGTTAASKFRRRPWLVLHIYLIAPDGDSSYKR